MIICFLIKIYNGLKKTKMNLIDYKCCKNVQIFKENANELIKHIKSDITYLDPPYTVKNYSENYQIFETIVEWNTDAIMKFKTKRNIELINKGKSKYSIRTGIKDEFTDLIENLDTSYIITSFSNSKTNTISIDELISILEKRGKVEFKKLSYKKYKSRKEIQSDLNLKEYILVTKC